VTILGTPTLVVGGASGQNFAVIAGVESTRVTPGGIPQIVLITSGGPVVLSCPPLGPAVPGQFGPRFTATCQGMTSPSATILPGSAVVVRFPVGGGSFIEVRGQAPLAFDRGPNGEPAGLAATLDGIDPELLAQPRVTEPSDFTLSLFHAPFDTVRQAAGPPKEPTVGAVSSVRTPLLGGLTASLLGANPLAADRPGTRARVDVAARPDGLPARLGWHPAALPSRL
jgi:hypothetical protein